MSTTPRTATVEVLVVKALQVDEPDWCVGHDEDGAHYKADILHQGPNVTLTYGGRPVSAAGLVQAPFSQMSSTEPGISLSLLGQTLGPDEVRAFADALTDHARQLHALADELAVLLARGGQ
ncbi:DUF6907 domain-containing protein [Streptomyces kebangsaanensis]|uniref:DUF6907 domain-containing protein n=1 Tax=Streptomyces kebangsaanensis TaxID=864058 RepID=A0ABW6KTW5_9ACTN